MAQSFFAFEPDNIHNIRFKMLHLIKWGFPYSDLRRIPLDEIDEYIKLINEYYEQQRTAQNSGASGPPEDPKSIGQINPSMFE